ncbi:flippase [Limosilactobacillus fermentum]|uniref:flippase n=1 Tax=Limosilactobacillus fermentum TaxID=1613 RepID=UPI003F05A624
MKNKSLGLNAIFNGLQSMLNMLFPLITFPYISRVLSVDGVGKYNFASSINSYFLMIAALGISTFAVREGAELRDDRKKISEFASKIFTVNLISTFITYFLLLLLLLIPSLHTYIVAILIFSIQIFFTTLGVDWMYVIFEEYGYITARNIIFKVISIILLFIFVRNTDDYLNYVAITVFATAGSNILNFFHAKKFCDIKINFNIDWSKYLPPILIIFASNAAIQIYTSSDITILGFLKNDYVVGIYSASTRIYNVINSTLISVTAVVIPRLAMLMGKKRIREYYRLLKQVINIIFILYIPAILGIFMVSGDIVKLLSGNNYLRSVSSLRILCFALLFSALAGTVNQCVLLPAKRENKSLISTIISAGVNIGLNFILIPIFSENGSALTTVIAEFTTLSLMIYYGRDILLGIFNDMRTFKNIEQIFLASVFVIVLCWCCQFFITNLILRLFMSVVSSGLAYVTVLYTLKNEIVCDFVDQIKFNIKK